MRLIDYDHMIQKVSAAASYPALSNPILPGRSVADPLCFDAARNQEIRHVCAEF